MAKKQKPPPVIPPITARQLLAFAAGLTKQQLKRLGLNVRADGSLSDHGR